MKKILFLCLLSMIHVTPLLAEELKLSPFETDGCTMFVDGPNNDPELWKHCCVMHDLRYWFGGTVSDMNQADLNLKECIQKVAGNTWATLIYHGVRAGHYSPIKHKYHWGWAWSVKRDKTPLTPQESAYVLSELKLLTVPELNMEEFIRMYFPNQTAL